MTKKNKKIIVNEINGYILRFTFMGFSESEFDIFTNYIKNNITDKNVNAWNSSNNRHNMPFLYTNVQRGDIYGKTKISIEENILIDSDNEHKKILQYFKECGYIIEKVEGSQNPYDSYLDALLYNNSYTEVYMFDLNNTHLSPHVAKIIPDMSRWNKWYSYEKGVKFKKNQNTQVYKDKEKCFADYLIEIHKDIITTNNRLTDINTKIDLLVNNNMSVVLEQKERDKITRKLSRLERGLEKFNKLNDSKI